MLEDSSNSMVNMAISLDPLQANKALGAIDRERMNRQKAALQPMADKYMPQYRAEERKAATASNAGGDYSADEFE